VDASKAIQKLIEFFQWLLSISAAKFLKDFAIDFGEQGRPLNQYPVNFCEITARYHRPGVCPPTSLTSRERLLAKDKFNAPNVIVWIVAIVTSETALQKWRADSGGATAARVAMGVISASLIRICGFAAGVGFEAGLSPAAHPAAKP